MTVTTRRTRREIRLLFLFVLVVAEQCLEFEFGLLAGFDEQDFRAQLLGDQLDHLVGERTACS